MLRYFLLQFLNRELKMVFCIFHILKSDINQVSFKKKKIFFIENKQMNNFYFYFSFLLFLHLFLLFWLLFPYQCCRVRLWKTHLLLIFSSSLVSDSASHSIPFCLWFVRLKAAYQHSSVLTTRFLLLKTPRPRKRRSSNL